MSTVPAIGSSEAASPVSLSVIPSSDGSSISVMVTVGSQTYTGTLDLVQPASSPAASAAVIGSYRYSGSSVTPTTSGSS